MHKSIAVIGLLALIGCAKQPGDKPYDVFLYYDHGCGAPQKVAAENMTRLLDDYSRCKVEPAPEDGAKNININCGRDRGIPRYFASCNKWNLPYGNPK